MQRQMLLTCGTRALLEHSPALKHLLHCNLWIGYTKQVASFSDGSDYANFPSQFCCFAGIYSISFDISRTMCYISATIINYNILLQELSFNLCHKKPHDPIIVFNLYSAYRCFIGGPQSWLFIHVLKRGMAWLRPEEQLSSFFLIFSFLGWIWRHCFFLIDMTYLRALD